MTLQHRHDFPGYEGTDATVTWWHNAGGTHTKYPHAHDTILETREHEIKARGPKAAKAPYTGPVDEYGQPVIVPDPNLAYANGEYEGEAAVAEATTVLELAAAITADADARMAARGITPSRRK